MGVPLKTQIEQCEDARRFAPAVRWLCNWYVTVIAKRDIMDAICYHVHRIAQYPGMSEHK